MSFIQIDNMSKRYLSGGVPVDALKGATLAIERGEFLAIAR